MIIVLKQYGNAKVCTAFLLVDPLILISLLDGLFSF